MKDGASKVSKKLDESLSKNEKGNATNTSMSSVKANANTSATLNAPNTPG